MNNFYITENQQEKLLYLKRFEENLQEFLPQLLQENKNCAYALANLTKKKKCAQILKPLLKKYEQTILSYLTSQDAKIRKYGYVICGNLPTNTLYNKLKQAIFTEETFYTLPSLMLSLVGKDAKILLDRVEKEKDNIPTKIYEQIKENYFLVCPKNFDRCNNLNFEKLNALIFTQPCYYDLLLKDLADYKKIKTKQGILLKDISFKNYQNLAKRRDIYSLSLILSQNSNLVDCIKNGLEKLNNMLPSGFFAYRISCKEKLFSEQILKLCKETKQSKIENSPTNYSISLEVLLDNQNFILTCLLEDCKPDFTYRQEFLPASINPITANIIGQIANFYNPNATLVADPFCGTATTLIERKIVNDKISLIATDLSKTAILKAKTNLDKIGFKAKAYNCDIANFTELNLCEIISNLPYGLRVGSHTQNQKIYSNLVKACNSSLKFGGFAFLYTADKKLLKGLIKSSNLTLVAEYPFVSGGLYCTLFVIKKEK